MGVSCRSGHRPGFEERFGLIEVAAIDAEAVWPIHPHHVVKALLTTHAALADAESGATFCLAPLPEVGSHLSKASAPGAPACNGLLGDMNSIAVVEQPATTMQRNRRYGASDLRSYP